jgi:hypothetical protein
MSRGLRGAGPSGGLLFLAVLVFVGWLVAAETDGLARIVLLVVAGAGVVALGADVLRRR